MISTLIYLTIMLVTGFMIGGFIAKSPATWITCLIIIAILSIIGIFIRYYRDRSSFRSTALSQFNKFSRKMIKIMSDPNKFANFSSFEIVCSIVNLLDASQKLSEEDFDNVYLLYRLFQRTDKQLRMDYDTYLLFCDDIIAHFDLLAPYHLFCGNDELNFAVLVEDEKKTYREKAKQLLYMGKLFQSEWMILHKEFKSAFYDT
ncbi:MAG: hypothetical protein E7585_01075 [Ruminococcaceae bacterium]|nr:hypothetical protein [Oscillospiraceae bacterium]